MNAIPGLTAATFFSGIGGFEIAFRDAGVTVTSMCEIDADCQDQLRLHFPGVTLFPDITEVSARDILAAGFVPGRGIVAGGWPCQDLSVAGRRAGLGGSRSGLFWHLVRLAGDLRPQWLIFENVPGLLSAVCPCPGDESCIRNGRAAVCGRWDTVRGQRAWTPRVTHAIAGGACPGGCMGLHGGAMGAVVGALEQLGYGLCWRVLDAQYFDVPQKRERIFFVGCLGDGAAPVEVLLEPESSGGDPAPRGEARPDVAGTLGSRAGGGRTTDPGGHGAYITGALTAGGLDGHDDNTARAHHLVTAPAVLASMGTSHGAPGHGGKDEPVIAVTAATLQGGGRRGHRIDAEGAAGGHLIAFDAAQITHPENRVNPQPGAAAPPLAATGQPMIGAVPFALRGREGASMPELGADGDPAPAPVVAYALSSRSTRNDREQTWVAVADPLTAGSRSEGVSRPARRQEDDWNLVAHPVAWRGRGMEAGQPGVANAVRSGGDGHTGDQMGYVMEPVSAVRRLTPLECERLQGFPDNWTKYRTDGRTQSDSARYRQCGNALAVPVARWITRRVTAAHQRLARRGAAA